MKKSTIVICTLSLLIPLKRSIAKTNINIDDDSNNIELSSIDTKSIDYKWPLDATWSGYETGGNADKINVTVNGTNYEVVGYAGYVQIRGGGSTVVMSANDFHNAIYNAGLGTTQIRYSGGNKSYSLSAITSNWAAWSGYY